MAHIEKDEIEMLPETLHVVEDSQLRRNVSRILNASISIPITSFQSYEENESLSQKVIAESTNTSYFGGADEIDWDNRHKYLMRSEKLGMCNDPYCTTCPTYLKKASRKPSTKVDAKFRLAYATPGSRVLGHCELVDHPKKIALNYLKHGLIIDLFIVLPIPQAGGISPVETELYKLIHEQQRLLSEVNMCHGAMCVYQSNISKNKVDLKQAQYNNIDKRYFD
ncbi:hypothetical protein Fmac_032625 [Flemingia macrophylla]|uniref:Uncharacterized protein n=1 Tax=Flemingia macrophylla TaxID=520843 RepID=A0ABD1L5H9_9FABA